MIRKPLFFLLALILVVSCSGKDLQELKAKDEVITKVNKLFIYTDSRDWKNVQKLFDKKVAFDMTSLAGGTPAELKPEQITSSWESGLKNLKVIHHQAGNYIVTISSAGADVFCYGTAVHYLPDKSGRNTRIFVGSYNIHLVKKESWVIDRFRYNSKFVEGNLDLGK